MKATETKLLEFRGKSPQFVIPIYQRTYSWSEKECRQLWHDILRTGPGPGVTAMWTWGSRRSASGPISSDSSGRYSRGRWEMAARHEVRATGPGIRNVTRDHRH